mmetsp:Transcript_12433/g.22254  ORF Transcript_12433/g.22254 Transcript_12433/m.22254 type:complete len:243 (+) Transcript_12433:672-1400(+)
MGSEEAEGVDIKGDPHHAHSDGRSGKKAGEHNDDLEGPPIQADHHCTGEGHADVPPPLRQRLPTPTRPGAVHGVLGEVVVVDVQEKTPTRTGLHGGPGIGSAVEAEAAVDDEVPEIEGRKKGGQEGDEHEGLHNGLRGEIAAHALFDAVEKKTRTQKLGETGGGGGDFWILAHGQHHGFCVSPEGHAEEVEKSRNEDGALEDDPNRAEVLCAEGLATERLHGGHDTKHRSVTTDVVESLRQD